MFQLEEPTNPVRVHVVRNRGPSQSNGMQQYIAQRQAEALQLRRRQPPRSFSRPDPGPEQALVRVDIAHAGEECLVEKSGLDGQAASPKELCEISLFDDQGLRSRSREPLTACQIPELEASEATRMDKA